MKCIRPTKFKNTLVYNRCGQCMPCRITRKTEWLTRLLLEYRYNNNLGAFVTLTYDNDHIPDDFSVQKTDVQKFLKRFRENLGRGKRISYYAVGEYGERFSRPHYHICIFGLQASLIEKLVKKSWTYGITQTDDLAQDGYNRMRYTLGYTLKKLTNSKAMEKHLDSREPEFSLQSRKPALGTGLVEPIARKCLQTGYYPARGINSAQKHYLHKHYPHLKPWNGYFIRDGKQCILDRTMQTAIFKCIYQRILDKFEKDEDFQTSNELWAKMQTDGFLSRISTTKFMTGEDYEQTVKKSEKQKRKYHKTQERSQF